MTYTAACNMMKKAARMPRIRAGREGITMRLKRYLKQYKDIIYPTVIIAAFYAVLNLIGITCPIKFATGISCPGCGMTRAWLAVLRLDFATAFYYHPLFMLPPIAVILFLSKAKINCKLYKLLILTICASFVITYAYRLMVTQGDIVVFEPCNNILFRLLRRGAE